MTNNEIRHTIATMMKDWDALTPAQQKRASLQADLTASVNELRARERAALHLTGIPQSENATAIAKLYDTFNRLLIELIESEAR